MAVKETIAIIGSENKLCTTLASKWAADDYPLLLLGNKAAAFEGLSAKINKNSPNADVETNDCVKNACWEADIIVFTSLKCIEVELIGKMKQVSAQKPVVYLSDTQLDEEISNPTGKLQQLLPNSKVVRLLYNENPLELSLSGTDKEAVLRVKKVVGFLA